MMSIPETILQRLRDAGLQMNSESLPTHHPWIPNGRSIIKPIQVGGNGQFIFEDDEDELSNLDLSAGDFCSTRTNAPMVWLFMCDFRWLGFRWCVSCRRGNEELRPGEFVNDFSTVEEAIADILDFYFGSPDRMNALIQAEEQWFEAQRQQNEAHNRRWSSPQDIALDENDPY